MTESRNYKICIIGIGNTMRSDDGVAEFICKELEKRFSKKITVIVTQQLDIAWAETIKNFDYVVFVDASVQEEAFFFEQVDGEDLPQTSSHHINVSALVKFTQQLYNVKTAFFLCGIKGHNFNFGFQLSEPTLQNSHKAVQLLTEWITDKL